MKRHPVTHLRAEWLQRSASASIAPPPRLFEVDADRPKRIDRYIDYFGGSGERDAERPAVRQDPRKAGDRDPRPGGRRRGP